MPEKNAPQAAFKVEKAGSGTFIRHTLDGYQPWRALTSKPPRGRSGGSSSSGSSSSASKPAKNASRG